MITKEDDFEGGNAVQKQIRILEKKMDTRMDGLMEAMEDKLENMQVSIKSSIVAGLNSKAAEPQKQDVSHHAPAPQTKPKDRKK